MEYEYKCIAAPEKARRRRGAKTRTDRVALAIEEILQAECTGGWEYLRADLIPVEEKNGFFSRTQEVHRAILIFRRAIRAQGATALQTQAAAVAPQAPAVAPAPIAAPVQVQQPAPAVSPQPEGNFSLSADREQAPDPDPVSSGRITAPKGLG